MLAGAGKAASKPQLNSTPSSTATAAPANLPSPAAIVVALRHVLAATVPLVSPGHVVWLGALVVVALTVHAMGFGRFREHSCRKWRWFFASVVGAVSLSLAAEMPWVSRAYRVAVSSPTNSGFWLLGLVLLWVVVASLQRLCDLWRRYFRTVVIPDPPAQPLLLVAVGSVIFGITVHFVTEQSLTLAPACREAVLGALLAVWILAPLAYAWLKPDLVAPSLSRAEKQENREPEAARTENANPSRTYYSDEPITRAEDDLFGRETFAQNLAEEIIKLQNPDSFVFALLGRWGEGKTSVMNLMKPRLKREASVIVIDFNPWYFGSESGVIEAFYGALERGLKSRFLLPGLARLARRYVGALSVGLHPTPFGLELKLPDSASRLRAELERFIESTGTRLVVLVDDVDRLSPELARAVLTLTRLSARLKNTVFLLGFDPTALTESLAKADVAPEFLDKIVQRPVTLPAIEQSDIDRFLLFSDKGSRSAIDQLFDRLGVSQEKRSQFDQKFVPIYQEHVSRFFPTLRHAKRFLNVLAASLSPVIEEVNLFDFCLLRIIEVFEPDIYRDIWFHREFYVRSPLGFGDLRYNLLTADRQTRNNLTREHMNALLQGKANRQVLEEILSTLFPDVSGAFGISWGIMHGSTVQPNEQRLGDPVSFPRYFLGRVPKGHLSDAEVRDAMRRWRESESVREAVIGDLESYQKREHLVEFLTRLDAFTPEIQTDFGVEIAAAIASFSGKLSWTENPNGQEARAALVLLLSLTEGPANARAKDILESVVANAAVDFVILLVAWLSASGSSFPKTKALVGAIKARAEQRLQSHFIDGERDVFADYPDAFAGLLYQWASNWVTGPRNPVVEGYVEKLIETNPPYLSQLLRKFAAQGERAIQLFTIIEPAKVLALINDHWAKGLLSDEDRQAAEYFRQRAVPYMKPVETPKS